MKLASKQYCMHNLVSMVVEKLLEKDPNKKEEDVIFEFSQSKTHENLFNEKTRLWAEGPDYIIELYEDELNIH